MDESYLLPASVTGRLQSFLIGERKGVVVPASGRSPGGRGPARCGTPYLAVPEVRTKPAWRGTRDSVRCQPGVGRPVSPLAAARRAPLRTANK